MPPKKNIGPTGLTVAANVRRLREQQKLSIAEVARRLAEIGHRIPVLGLSQVEKAERRVDAEELVALAEVLGVSPATLLMPESATADEQVIATGTGQTTAERLWAWLTAEQPLDSGVQTNKIAGGVVVISDPDGAGERFLNAALPRFKRHPYFRPHPARLALNDLDHWVALAASFRREDLEPSVGEGEVDEQMEVEHREFLATQLRRGIRAIVDLADDVEGRSPTRPRE